MIDEIVFSDVLIESAKEVFETMIFMDITPATDPQAETHNDSLLSSITFTGDLEGCLTICCDTNCSKDITANMLGMEPDEDISQEDIYDALGEVANMLLGSVKARIHEAVGTINVSIPSVISGRELENSLGEGFQKIKQCANLADQHIVEFSFSYREKK